jgi:hypothetical protein
MAKKPMKPTTVVAETPMNLAVEVTARSSVPLAIEFTIEHEPLPDNHPILPLIGQAASEFARFEHILDLRFVHLPKDTRDCAFQLVI